MRSLEVLCAVILLGCSAGSLGAESPAAESGFAGPYAELLKLFPQEHQGQGVDRGGPVGAIADQPMTYGLILSAESLRYRAKPSDEGKNRVRLAARWLVDNSHLSGDGKPGWGLPNAWEHRPKNTSYTITTSNALEGLLDALTLSDFWQPQERDEMVQLMRQVHLRWCRELWADGFGGGYFCYSPADMKPGYLCVNAPAMYLGALIRFVHEHAKSIPADERRLFESRADGFAQSAVTTATLRDGAPYWDYMAPPNPTNSKRPNDLLHHAYILWGLETYRDQHGSVPLPWTRAKAVESLDRFWKDGTPRFFAQDESTVKPGNREAPANLWGAGMLLACYARWGSPEQTQRCFSAIGTSYGPFPRMRVLPRAVSDDGQFYPRDAAHVLYGLGYSAYRR